MEAVGRWMQYPPLVKSTHSSPLCVMSLEAVRCVLGEATTFKTKVSLLGPTNIVCWSFHQDDHTTFYFFYYYNQLNSVVIK